MTQSRSSDDQPSAPPIMPMKAGELAELSGVTVRTLHHYEEVGLLSPERQASSGHRIYDHEELRRLQHILALRQVGMGLPEIARVLSQEGPEPIEILDMQIERLQAQIGQSRGLLDRLQTLRQRWKGLDQLPVEELIAALTESKRLEAYYSADQFEELRQRAKALGPEAIQAAEEEWPLLAKAMRAAKDEGLAPEHPEVQPLARRWQELVEAFTNRDPAITRSLAKVWENEPDIGKKHDVDIDTELMAFAGQAIASLDGAS